MIPDLAPLDIFGLRERVAVVTGGNRGLGLAAATLLGRAGASIAIVGRDTARLEAAAAGLAADGIETLACAADIASTADLESVRDRVLARFGSIDVLVNSAGISPVFRRAEHTSADDWEAVLRINVTGTAASCRVLGSVMIERGRGAVVNVSSIGASSALGKLSAYNASKGAVEALTRTLALEWAPRGVRVNAVAPGFIPTDMTEGVLAKESLRAEYVGRTLLGRLGTPGEVASAILFLASDAASYVTGEILHVDGGWHAA